MNSSEDFPPFMEKSFYTQYYPLCGGPAADTVYPAMEAAQYADREVSKYRMRRRKGRMQGRVARA